MNQLVTRARVFALSLFVAFFSSVPAFAVSTVTINGTVCNSTQPWSVSTSASTTNITIPAECLGTGGGACTAAPTISAVTPTSGPIGQAITITGTNFCAGATVSVNGIAATNVAVGATSISATIAAGTTSGSVVVTTTAGTATSAQPFTVNTNPAVSAITPAGAAPGATVTITGVNFAGPGPTSVTFDGVQAFLTGVTATSITTTIPSSVTPGKSVPVVVTATISTGAPFNYQVGCPGGCATGDLTIEGDIIPTPSRTAGGLTPSPLRNGKLNGAGPFLNAYAAADVATKCANSSPAVTRLWQHNISFSGYASSGGNDYPILGPNEAMTWKFVAPAEGTANQIQYNEGTQASFQPGYLTISTTPCDFATSSVFTGGTGNACYRSEAYGVSIYYKATTGTALAYECKLTPGATYYLNFRLQDARPAAVGGNPLVDSCAASGALQCGGFVQIR